MNSRLYSGHLRHHRNRDREHWFSYRLHLFCLDLDELAMLDRSSTWFGYNRFRPLALYDRDYLHPGEQPIRDKVDLILAGQGMQAAKVLLVTAVRQFNYIFNPVSFFYCFNPDNQLAVVIAQVNNTFGEMHLYILRAQADDSPLQCEKAFHVSPFFPRKGDYTFHLPPPASSLELAITYRLEDATALRAEFSGQGEPLTPAILRRTVLLHPFRALLTMPRILWQAARLFFEKRLAVYLRPEPNSTMTIRHRPASLGQRLAMGVIGSFFSRLDSGCLELTLPDGTHLTYGSKSDGLAAEMTVRRLRFFSRAALAADIGFGESFVDGDWDSPDLVQLLSLLALKERVLDDRRIWTAIVGQGMNLLAHLQRANTVPGSRRNISDHYDLSNDFYSLFLDPTMSYSGGLFESADDSLEQAQRNKMRAIVERAGIGPEDHVLEIGCGWGGFAVEAVRRTGCRLTGITVSREQHQYALERVREEGLEDRIDIRLTDYRHVTGTFSKIISIEMLEAVGHKYLPTFFSVLDTLLAPGGKVVLQVIAIPDQKYQRYRRGSDWIRKHIFPGGHLPSLGAMGKAIADRTRLNIVALEDIGGHYAMTLNHWRQEFLTRRNHALELGFDNRFLRQWEYYLSYCEAAFKTQVIRNYHLVLARMGEVAGELNKL